MTLLCAIDGTTDTPEVRFHANPACGLYHWLRAASTRGQQSEGDGFAQAFDLVRQSFEQRGVRGMVEPWESAIAKSKSHGEALAAFERAYRQTGSDMAEAMRSAEPAFMVTVWPGHLAAIAREVDALRQRFAPVFPELAREHEALLDLDWPFAIDVHLVGDMAGFEGAYSHPLTIDLSQHNGLTLFETILHEATHVADVNGTMRGQPSLGDRLIASLAGREAVASRRVRCLARGDLRIECGTNPVALWWRVSRLRRRTWVVSPVRGARNSGAMEHVRGEPGRSAVVRGDPW